MKLKWVSWCVLTCHPRILIWRRVIASFRIGSITKELLSSTWLPDAERVSRFSVKSKGCGYISHLINPRTAGKEPSSYLPRILKPCKRWGGGEASTRAWRFAPTPTIKSWKKLSRKLVLQKSLRFTVYATPTLVSAGCRPMVICP